MKLNHALYSVFNSPWLVDRDFAQGILPVLSNVVLGVTEFDSRQQDPEITFESIHGSYAATVATIDDARNLNLQELHPNTNVYIPIVGPLTKADQNCGENPGYGTLTYMVQKLNQSDKISNLIFLIDSPGGQVSGLNSLIDAIQASQINTIAFVNDGIAASAAYWIASACNSIYASHDSCTLGSIGVYQTIVDTRGMLEKAGIQLHEIYSRHSTNKNIEFRQALDGKYDLVQDDLDAIATQFINSVHTSRNIPLNSDVFSGKKFTALQAIKNNLIDGIMSLPQLTQSIQQMSLESKINALAGSEDAAERAQLASEIIAMVENPLQLSAEEIRIQQEAAIQQAVQLAVADLPTAEELQAAIDQRTLLQSQLDKLQAAYNELESRRPEPSNPSGSQDPQPTTFSTPYTDLIS